MAYEIEVLPSAAKQLKKLAKGDEGLANRLSRAIDKLADDPRAAGSIVLSNSEGLMRCRVGNYRVLYEVHDRRIVVVIVKVGHRRDIYKK